MSARYVELSPSSVIIVTECLEEKIDQLQFFQGLRRVTEAERSNYQLQQKLIEIALLELEAGDG